jgi:hypothetical protein
VTARPQRCGPPVTAHDARIVAAFAAFLDATGSPSTRRQWVNHSRVLRALEALDPPLAERYREQWEEELPLGRRIASLPDLPSYAVAASASVWTRGGDAVCWFQVHGHGRLTHRHLVTAKAHRHPKG